MNATRMAGGRTGRVWLALLGPALLVGLVAGLVLVVAADGPLYLLGAAVVGAYFLAELVSLLVAWVRSVTRAGGPPSPPRPRRAAPSR